MSFISPGPERITPGSGRWFGRGRVFLPSTPMRARRRHVWRANWPLVRISARPLFRGSADSSVSSVSSASRSRIASRAIVLALLVLLLLRWTTMGERDKANGPLFTRAVRAPDDIPRCLGRTVAPPTPRRGVRRRRGLRRRGMRPVQKTPGGPTPRSGPDHDLHCKTNFSLRIQF